MKKILTRVAVVIFSVMLGILPMSACKSDRIVRDGKTFYIKAWIGGYGDSWLYALAEKFNAVYEQQGYVAKVLPSSYDLEPNVAMKELYSKDDWADLYFVNVNNTMSQFTESGGEYGQLVADLTDTVWNKPAINFKGEEESAKPLSEKMRVTLPDDVLKVNGRVYGFNTSNDIGGMIVNTEKLAKYGVTEIPKTTDELFDVFELIYMGDASKGIKGSLESNVYPVTFLSGDNGYPLHFVTAWHAQYAGIEEYTQFYGYTDADGNERRTDGYEVYDSAALDKMLEAMYQMSDMILLCAMSIVLLLDPIATNELSNI